MKFNKDNYKDNTIYHFDGVEFWHDSFDGKHTWSIGLQYQLGKNARNLTPIPMELIKTMKEMDVNRLYAFITTPRGQIVARLNNGYKWDVDMSEFGWCSCDWLRDELNQKYCL